MKADRLATVLRVRELVERRRLAERAAAERAAEDQRAAHAAALTARSGAVPEVGATLTPGELAGVRLGGLALDEVVDQVAGERQVAEHRSVAAERALVVAAIERRSAERLRDRRAAAEAKRERRATERRDDDVALQQWRTRP